VSLNLCVGIGSAAGGVIRFLLGTLIQQKTGSTFTVGTLAINVTGSLVLGFVVRYALATPAIGPEIRALLTAGLCGGYTTFSTFSYETVALIEEGDYRRAPIIVECVETEENITAILPEIDRMIEGGLITLERAKVIMYRANLPPQQRGTSWEMDMTGLWDADEPGKA
jgi:CrcB protein